MRGRVAIGLVACHFACGGSETGGDAADGAMDALIVDGAIDAPMVDGAGDETEGGSSFTCADSDAPVTVVADVTPRTPRTIAAQLHPLGTFADLLWVQDDGPGIWLLRSPTSTVTKGVAWQSLFFVRLGTLPGVLWTGADETTTWLSLSGHSDATFTFGHKAYAVAGTAKGDVYGAVSTTDGSGDAIERASDVTTAGSVLAPARFEHGGCACEPSQLGHLAIDDAHLYYVDALAAHALETSTGKDTVLAPLDGAPADAVTGNDLAADDTTIFFSDVGVSAHAIRSAPKSGGAPTTLTEDVVAASSGLRRRPRLATDGVALYYADAGPRIVKLAKDGSVRCVLVHETSEVLDIAVSDSKVFWIVADAVKSAPTSF